MAPRTRNISKRAGRPIPTTEMLMEVECSEMVFNPHPSVLQVKVDQNFFNFFKKVEELAADVTAMFAPPIDVRVAVDNFLEGVLKPTSPWFEIDNERKDQTAKNDTLNLLETSSISFIQSQEEVLMEVDEDSNRTDDIFGVRSETLTSSEDDMDTTAISEASTRLGEMSLTEELNMVTPLHTSTPLKSEDVTSETMSSSNSLVSSVFAVRSETMTSSEDDLDTTAISEVKTGMVLRDNIGNLKTDLKVKSEYSSLDEEKRMSGFQSCPMTSGNVSIRSRATSVVSSQILKQEIVDDFSTIDSVGLQTPKKEHRLSNSKIEHANNLRSKFLMTKKEKLREENEKKAAKELEQRRMLEEQKQKSSSRHGASLKRTEAFTPNRRETKKVRVHLFSKEDKPPKLNDVETLIPRHEPQTSTHSIKKTRIKKNENSHHTTPESKNNEDDYGIDDLHSGEATDNESRPRKTIPKWAYSTMVKKNVRKQTENPPFDIDQFFGTVEKPVLGEIFGKNYHSKIRGSSSCWKKETRA